MLLEQHLATVLAVDGDPDKEYGIKVQIDEILEGAEYPEIAKPLFPPNFIKAPKKGQTISVLAVATEDGEPGDRDLGVEEYSSFLYYTGRIFDLKQGRVPNELKTNYPKRSGWWGDDGTIIYFDETSGSKQIALVLSGGQNYVKIHEQYVEMKYGSQVIKLNDTEVSITANKVSSGAENADFRLIKGTNTAGDTGFLPDFNTLLAAWLAAAQALKSAGPTGVVAYATAVESMIQAIQLNAGNWPSTKSFTSA